MRDPDQLWTLHNLASAYGMRPSQMVGEQDSWAAYQLDAATLVLGRWIEHQLGERDRRGHRRHTASGLLAQLRARRAEIDQAQQGTAEQAAPSRAPRRALGEFGRLLQHAAPWRRVRKVRVGPDGTW